MTTSTRSLVFIHPSDEIYGADRMLLEQLASVPADIDVEVWLPSDLEHPRFALCEELQRNGFKATHVDLPILRRAYRTPRDMLGLARRVMRLRRRLREVAPDVVYCTTSAASLGVPVARWARVPTVIGHVQEIWSDGDRRVLAPLLRAGHRLIAISNAVAAELPPALRARTTVVPNGAPPPQVATSVEGRSGPLVFAVASRWNGWKGHGTLLKAWNQVPQGRLLVLGGPPLSGERTDVPAIVAGLDRPESVDIVGEVADPAPYLAQADVVIVPSDAPEPFGLVAVEAFAMGRPVVASAAGGLLDIIDDGHNGWLYPLGDADALAQCIRTLNRADVEVAGKRARETYETRYTNDQYAERWRSAVGIAANLPQK